MSEYYAHKVLNLAGPALFVEQSSAEIWAKLERKLGFSLPQDYKILVSTLGSGNFGELGLLNPASSSRYTRFTESKALEHNKDIQTIAKEAGVCLFPASNGFLTVGLTGVSRVLLVATGSKSSEYKVCWLNLDYSRAHILSMSVCHFIHDLYLKHILAKWAIHDQQLIWGTESPFFTPRSGHHDAENIQLLS